MRVWLYSRLIQCSVSLKNYNYSLIKIQIVQTFSTGLYDLNIFLHRSLAALYLTKCWTRQEKKYQLSLTGKQLYIGQNFLITGFFQNDGRPPTNFHKTDYLECNNPTLPTNQNSWSQLLLDRVLNPFSVAHRNNIIKHLP